MLMNAPLASGARSVRQPWRWQRSDGLKWIIALIAVPIVVAGTTLMIAQGRTPTYESGSTLMVTFGEEYIFRPVAADQESWAPWSDQLAVNAELAILNSDSLRDRVIDRVGVEKILGKAETETENVPATQPTFYSDARSKLKRLARYVGLTEPEVKDLERARELWRRSINIKGAKDTTVISLSYRHSDADIAALVVDVLVDEYLNTRSTIYAKPGLDAIAPLLARSRKNFTEALVSMRAFNTEVGGEYEAISGHVADEIGSLTALLAGFDREIAGKEASSALTEVVGSSSQTGLSRAISSNMALAALKSERDKTARQLEVLRQQFQTLSSREVEYAFLKEQLENARRAFQQASELKDQVDSRAEFAGAHFSNVKILQPGTQPHSPINLPASTLAILTGGIAFLTLLTGFIIFAGRGTAPGRVWLEG